MNIRKLLFIFILLFVAVVQAVPQDSFSGDDIRSEFNRAMDLFNKEKYAPAIRLFDSYIQEGKDNTTIHLDEAEYYAALSALRLFNPDAEYRMLIYLSRHPESPRLNEGRISLADYFYQNKSYRKACNYYETVNRFELSDEKLPEYYFRYGYSLYVKGDKAKALTMFSEIKDKDTEYSAPAIYYFSHIAYEQKMYETALEGFNKLRGDETFGSIVSFYNTQILYLTKDYDGILEVSPELLKSAPKERAIEMYRFIGDAYYNKGNYAEALTYLEQYNAGAKSSEREDRYQLGFCYYKTGNIDQAIKTLLSAGAKSDILSQNIWFVLGDCYLKAGDKKKAQFAFGQASRMDFDAKLKEESLLSYAKLTYETSTSPFGEAIAAFQEYIDLYPNSPNVEEAYNYLVATFTEVRNYQAALSALDRIRNKDSRLEAAYQRVAFFRGLELFKNMQIEESIDMFEKSLQYERHNRELKARAVYWKAEAEYRTGQYESASFGYTTFMGIPGAMSLPEASLLRYNLGYVWFNLKDYNKALTEFRTFESGAGTAKPEIQYDARLRIADCYFINTNYAQAVSYYDKVIAYGKDNADYALYQKGFCLGLTNDNPGKTEILTLLTTRFPSSPYVPNAIYERGRAYLVLEDYRRGEADFINIIANYPSSSYVPQAIVQLGLLYYNQGENEKSVAQFRKVIENYPSTPEARYAMTGLKNAYVDMNDVESYFTYVRNLGFGDVSVTERDSLLYVSGENLYIAGNCTRASEVFRNYLREFQNGSFRLNAQFYLAECLNSSGSKEEALGFYREVIKTPNNQFMEQALIAASAILYGQEEYSDAFTYYETLEKITTTPEFKLTAMRGQLRSAYQDGDAQKSILASDRIRKAAKIPEELMREAVFISAKAHYSLNEFDEALKDFRITSNEVVSAEGAESKYRVAEILFKKGSIDESERIVNQFIGQNSPHPYWTARMFLLLADISIQKGDTLQARATLQSLQEYYTVSDDGILDEVKAKLASLDQGN
ncbi:MAG: tetratricopeptide repeat protein [Bacteroidales bacterium]|nr:tetratricopeptide repeat protein [Bacteroidales bacterium]